MNEISGFGGIQPLRSAGAARISVPKQTAETSSLPEEQKDLVNISIPHNNSLHSTERIDGVKVNQAAEAPAASASSFTAQSNQVQDFEGFLLAGSHSGKTSTHEAPQVQVSSLGTIAVIDDPEMPESAEVAPVQLNGPSTASQGIYTLSGLKLA